MKISRLEVRNFRGISSATLLFPDKAVLIGDNNTGKSTVLEAIDLVLGPDRVFRRPPVDEHDFYQGRYLETLPVAENEKPTDAPSIFVEAIITGLSGENLAHFHNYLEWWNHAESALHAEPPPEGVDAANIDAALRVAFVGKYDADEDDFVGSTYFSRSLEEDEKPEPFKKRDKQRCGFLYLRSLRTGTRALSLEHGSLLDIILRLKEIRPQMWESTIENLAAFDVAADPALGISGVLQSINAALKRYVPKEWGAEPHLKVSALTREHLRSVVTAFIATGDGDHAAPYFRQGTGTINMLVLAMLSQIAQDKQNVIFAMEEPETAIPPYAQKRIVHEVSRLSSQAIFTSHSPYVLEEFGLPNTVHLSRDANGTLTQSWIKLPESVKLRRYRHDFRTRFSEGLLSRRVVIAEGATECAALPVAARRLAELKPSDYQSLESLGVCTIDAGGENQVADLGKLYRGLGKCVYALCDKQTDLSKKKIELSVDRLFMHDEAGFEDLVLKNTTAAALERFAKLLEWPPHILNKYGSVALAATNGMSEYFEWSKGSAGVADFLAQCEEHEFPDWIKQTCKDLKELATGDDNADDDDPDDDPDRESDPDDLFEKALS